MAYAILRTAKLKTQGSIAASLAHTFRTRDTPNAAPERLADNEHNGPTNPDAVRAAITARLPDKPRKNGVLCIEYFIGASPEFFQEGGDQNTYFTDAVRWLQHKHGAANVLSWSIHRDETSPHLVAYVVPLDDKGKLNARHFLGGRATLSAMQTDFASTVGARVGLERGIEGSKATHTTIRQYYRALNQSDFKQGRVHAETLEPKVLEKRFLINTVESPEQVAERLTRVMRTHYAPALAVAATATLDKRRAKDMAATAQAKAAALREAQQLLNIERQRAADLQAVFLDGLSPDQQRDLADTAAEQRRQNWIWSEAERRAQALVELAKKTVGAARAFAQRGLAAIEEVAGHWRSVDWGLVERETVRDLVSGRGRPMDEVVRVLLEHSPGHAGTSQEQAAVILSQVERRTQARAIPRPASPDRGLTR